MAEPSLLTVRSFGVTWSEDGLAAIRATSCGVLLAEHDLHVVSPDRETLCPEPGWAGVAPGRPGALTWRVPRRGGGAPASPAHLAKLVGVSDHDELLAEIKNKAIVYGRVVLTSGQEADFYIDLRRVTLDGSAAPRVGRVMLDLTSGLEYDAVGGLTLGADPVATAILHAAAARGRKLDAFVVRKSDKVHGLQRRIEGPDVAGRRVLALEDTSTTGNSVLTAVDALREAGAEVAGVAAIVERGAKGRIAASGLPYRAAYTLADLGIA